MSQQALKDLVGSIAGLLGRKALNKHPAGPREDRKPPSEARPPSRPAARAGEGGGRWLLAHESGGWFVYPPHSPHRPSVSKGEVYVLYFLPEETTEFTSY